MLVMDAQLARNTATSKHDAGAGWSTQSPSSSGGGLYLRAAYLLMHNVGLEGNVALRGPDAYWRPRKGHMYQKWKSLA